MTDALTTGKDMAGLKTLQTISMAGRFNTWMYDTIKPYIKGRVLELGSGIGNITDHLTADFSEITISDYDTDYCTYLKNKYAEKKNVVDVLNIDLQDPYFFHNYKHLENTFDSIILLNVIEHLADDDRCVAYCRFMLRPHGNFIVLAPAYSFLYSAFDKEIGHYRRYSASGLAKLLARGQFAVIHKQYFNALGTTGWLLFNKLLGRKAISNSSMKSYDRLVPVGKWIDKLLANKLGLSAIAIGKKNEESC